MRELLFTEADKLINCQLKDDAILFTKESEVVFYIDAEEEGYYYFIFSCRLIHGDAWHNVMVVGENGESIQYKIGFSRMMPETEYYLHLYQGRNTIKIAGDYGEIEFQQMKYSEKPVSPISSVAPTRDIYYKDAPKHLKVHLIHYNHKLEKFLVDGTERPFIQRPTDTEELVQGDALIRSDIIIQPDILGELSEGPHNIIFLMDNGEKLNYDLTVAHTRLSAPFEILNFNIDHGNATLITFPSGKHLLIDSAKDYYAENVIIPYLKANDIKVDYYLLTHFHDDHNGMLEEILKQNEISQPELDKVENLLTKEKEFRYSYLSQYGYLDKRMVLPFDRLDQIWDLGGVEMTVLNSSLDSQGYPTIDDSDENNSSVSLNVEYKGFRYHHAADNYANVEERMLSLWEARGEKDFLKCDYFYANHHFHGSVSDQFIRFINPAAVFVSAQGAVYARAAYTTVYRKGVAEKDFEGKRLMDTLLSCEVGSTLVRVWDKGNWQYECFDDLTEL